MLLSHLALLTFGLLWTSAVGTHIYAQPSECATASLSHLTLSGVASLFKSLQDKLNSRNQLTGQVSSWGHLSYESICSNSEPTSSTHFIPSLSPAPYFGTTEDTS